jgi:hypothetical protein
MRQEDVHVLKRRRECGRWSCISSTRKAPPTSSVNLAIPTGTHCGLCMGSILGEQETGIIRYGLRKSLEIHGGTEEAAAVRYYLAHGISYSRLPEPLGYPPTGKRSGSGAGNCSRQAEEAHRWFTIYRRAEKRRRSQPVYTKKAVRRRLPESRGFPAGSLPWKNICSQEVRIAMTDAGGQSHPEDEGRASGGD